MIVEYKAAYFYLRLSYKVEKRSYIANTITTHCKL